MISLCPLLPIRLFGRSGFLKISPLDFRVFWRHKHVGGERVGSPVPARLSPTLAHRPLPLGIESRLEHVLSLLLLNSLDLESLLLQSLLLSSIEVAQVPLLLHQLTRPFVHLRSLTRILAALV